MTDPQPGDLVVVTHEPVARTIADRQRTVAKAMEKGLVGLYRTPGQELAAAEPGGGLGAEPRLKSNPGMDHLQKLESIANRSNLTPSIRNLRMSKG